MTHTRTFKEVGHPDVAPDALGELVCDDLGVLEGEAEDVREQDDGAGLGALIVCAFGCRGKVCVADELAVGFALYGVALVAVVAAHEWRRRRMPEEG